MPITSFGIVLGGMSLIGVPGTAGFISKWYLILAALESGHGGWWRRSSSARCWPSRTCGASSRWRTFENHKPLSRAADGSARIASPGVRIGCCDDLLRFRDLGDRRLCRQRRGDAARRRDMSGASLILCALALPMLGAMASRWPGQPNLRETVTLATSALLFCAWRRCCRRARRCAPGRAASGAAARTRHCFHAWSRWACCSRSSLRDFGSSTRSTLLVTCAATTKHTRRGSTFSSRLRSKRPSALPSPPTSSRCFSSTRC